MKIKAYLTFQAKYFHPILISLIPKNTYKNKYLYNIPKVSNSEHLYFGMFIDEVGNIMEYPLPSVDDVIQKFLTYK